MQPAAAPDRAPLPSFHAAYGAWHAEFGRYGQLVTRARHAWRAIEQWTAQHCPAIRASLRPGASESQLEETEQQLGYALPPALRVLYRVHDGQELEFDRQVDRQRAAAHESMFHGMFGGYSFYSHLVSTRMLPLRRMLRWTRTAHQQLGFPPGDQRALFAASHNFNKMLYCDAASGLVHVASVDKRTCLQAVPDDAPDAAQCDDGALRWFEAYAAALCSGRFPVEPLEEEYPTSVGISLFPQLPPWRSEAVTQGVRVRASPLFIPELTQVAEDEEPQYFFAYSVRFSLLTPEEAAAAVGDAGSVLPPAASHDSVQLRSRYWAIRDAAGAIENEVRGEAVVGHYPLLRPGHPDFVYQSCTHQRQPAGSMEGHFAFVEGSLQAPGREFNAACAPLSLDVPQVIF
ncbi:F-box SKIP16 isoform A [Micractinium conductrix]|uniref:F-box SKIP16 isoform A n=1 Tax=Micractinium conductrix TaxID=554055 RepID=A0A2P6VQN7_9CHLO|nr:F-box SKIP16 isoform A [Micractinium conductrix]|eukprot:PSC76399.1 F-box SKIP16 isoform A [Micractinium conductrix]